MEFVGETLRAALEALAVAAPTWLSALIDAEWAERYGPRVDDYRSPKGEEVREQWSQQVGRDGLFLLEAVYAPDTRPAERRPSKADQPNQESVGQSDQPHLIPDRPHTGSGLHHERDREPEAGLGGRSHAVPCRPRRSPVACLGLRSRRCGGEPARRPRPHRVRWCRDARGPSRSPTWTAHAASAAGDGVLSMSAMEVPVDLCGRGTSVRPKGRGGDSVVGLW